jgi:uncharacterized DUF497 family protein
MDIEWDANKAAANRRKHGVTFDEASEVFEPQKPLILEDEDHSEAEDRYYAIGVSSRGRMLTVCFAYRGELVRIISARKSIKREMELYADEVNKRA